MQCPPSDCFLIYSCQPVEPPSGPLEWPKWWVLCCYVVGLDCAKPFVKSLYSDWVQIVKTSVVDLKGKETDSKETWAFPVVSVIFVVWVVFSFFPPSHWSKLTFYDHDRCQGREIGKVWLWVEIWFDGLSYIELLIICIKCSIGSDWMGLNQMWQDLLVHHDIHISI